MAPHTPQGNLTQIVFNTFFRSFLNCFNSLHHLLHIQAKCKLGPFEFFKARKKEEYMQTICSKSRRIYLYYFIFCFMSFFLYSIHAHFNRAFFITSSIAWKWSSIHTLVWMSCDSNLCLILLESWRLGKIIQWPNTSFLANWYM